MDWLHGALLVRFHLPGDAVAIVCHAHAGELVFDEGTEQERAALAALDLEGLTPDAALRIELRRSMNSPRRRKGVLQA